MNLDSIKSAAQNRWPEILSRLAGVDVSTLTGRHGPCPRCGGTDRFRFTNMDNHGSAICNQCGKFGDGLATLGWLLGVEFKESASRVASCLGVEATANGTAKKTKSKFIPPIDRITVLRTPGTREAFAAEFAAAKEGIDVDVLLRCRWAPAVWPRGGSSAMQTKVLAFVSHRLPTLAEHSYILYRRDGKPFPPMLSLPERKAHVVSGSAKSGEQDGIVIVGTLDEFRSAKRIWKYEGVTDALAAAYLLVAGEIAFANICGAGSCDWINAGSFARFDRVTIIGDNDPSGVGLSGATKTAGILLAQN